MDMVEAMKFNLPQEVLVHLWQTDVLFKTELANILSLDFLLRQSFFVAYPGMKKLIELAVDEIHIEQ